MKKQGVLNAHLSHVIARLGHTDRLVVCDAGLPIPRSAELVDLALTRNVPRFLQTVGTILQEMEVDEAVVAAETEKVNPALYNDLKRLLPGVTIKSVTHEEFKQLTCQNGNITFVRTGEVTPFANVILISGVDFD
jgi:D-ribose pyranase